MVEKRRLGNQRKRSNNRKRSKRSNNRKRSKRSNNRKRSKRSNNRKRSRQNLRIRRGGGKLQEFILKNNISAVVAHPNQSPDELFLELNNGSQGYLLRSGVLKAFEENGNNVTDSTGLQLMRLGGEGFEKMNSKDFIDLYSTVLSVNQPGAEERSGFVNVKVVD
jgi:hypothetical protein